MRQYFTVRNAAFRHFDSIGILPAVSDRQRKLAQQWLDILGIDKRTADAPSTVSRDSSGWRRSCARWLAPTVLILDEPLQGLDSAETRQLVRRL